MLPVSVEFEFLICETTQFGYVLAFEINQLIVWLSTPNGISLKFRLSRILNLYHRETLGHFEIPCIQSKFDRHHCAVDDINVGFHCSPRHVDRKSAIAIILYDDFVIVILC